MPTERLYYRDATLLTFSATASLEGIDGRRLTLDRSAFYPTSGGQPHDTGTINGVQVTDVLDDGDDVVHVLDAPLGPGPVTCVVDAPRRHDHMQQHTAQHLLSAIAADHLGWNTTSVHFGAQHSTIEFDVPVTSAAERDDLEARANAIVADARPIVVTFEDAARAAGLRTPSTRHGEIRVVSITGVDRSACGGTHVARTSEIGPIVLTGTEPMRGGVRVAFVAGDRAFTRMRGHDALLRELAAGSQCSVGELLSIVSRRQQEVVVMRRTVERLESDTGSARLAALVATQAPDADGVRRIVHRIIGDEHSVVKAMAQAVGPLEQVLFIATAPVPPSIVFATSADTGIDAGVTLRTALTAVGGRGGGSPRLAQGSAPDPSHLRDIVASLLAP